jgi:hypothetical protein
MQQGQQRMKRSEFPNLEVEIQIGSILRKLTFLNRLKQQKNQISAS